MLFSSQVLWLLVGVIPIITASPALVLPCYSVDGHLEKVSRREIASFIMTGSQRNSDSKTWKELEGSLNPKMSKWQSFSNSVLFARVFR